MKEYQEFALNTRFLYLNDERFIENFTSETKRITDE